MNKVKIAKELVKLAKSLVAEYQPSLFNEYHDIDVERCCLITWFDESIFDSDYECIHYSNNDRNIYLYSNAIEKKPYEIFEMDFEDDEIDERGTNWKEFFSSCASSWLNNATMREGWKFKKPYAYVVSTGYSQSDTVQVIYDTTEITNNAKAYFDEFFWQDYVDLEIKIDNEYYDQYDILGDDLEFYDKNKVIEGVKKIMGNEFNDDVKNQLE